MAIAVTGLTVKEETVLRKAALEADRSLAGQVRWIIRQWLKGHKSEG